MGRSLVIALLGTLLSACSQTPTPGQTSSAPPSQVRCVMAEADRSILFLFSSSPANLEQSAIAENCVANGRMGKTWAPLPTTTSTEGYLLVCEGIIAGQAKMAVWMLKSDPTAAGRAYDACHVIPNPTYTKAP